VTALAAVAGLAEAQAQVAPANTEPPTITGTARDGRRSPPTTVRGPATIRDATVLVTGVPLGWITAPQELRTNADGLATLQLQPTTRLRVVRGGSMVMFIRARKEGDSILAGVSSRRLVRVRTAPRPPKQSSSSGGGPYEGPSSPRRRRQNQSAPPAAARPETIAPLFGRFESSALPGSAAFALRFATRFPTCHTLHPRTAFRLFTMPTVGAYPPPGRVNRLTVRRVRGLDLRRVVPPRARIDTTGDHSAGDERDDADRRRSRERSEAESRTSASESRRQPRAGIAAEGRPVASLQQRELLAVRARTEMSAQALPVGA